MKRLVKVKYSINLNNDIIVFMYIYRVCIRNCNILFCIAVKDKKI